jgi:perosamine synthetase
VQCVSGGPASLTKRYRVYEPRVAKNQKAYVNDALDRNELTFRGGYVPRFEKALAAKLGAKHVVATTNGTVSLLALYHTLFPPKAVVVTPSMTYAATVSQLKLLGMMPLYVDCDRQFQMDVDQLRTALRTMHVDGVVLPCLYADAPNLTEVMGLCYRYDVPLIIDAAEAFLCTQGGVDVGKFGAAASYSFFANKVITSGEGGCVTTGNENLAGKVRLFCNQATTGNYQHVGVGSNFRMTNLQAAVGLAQLEEVEEILIRKRAIAGAYRNMLDGRFEAVVPTRVWSSEWMPVFRLPGKHYLAFREHCDADGVEVRPCFYPVHEMSGFEGLTPFDLAVSKQLADSHFILPCHPGLEMGDLEYIVGVANAFEEQE